jgi:hypothetical protein
MPDRKRRRVNGLERPWHEFQIATWVLFPLILVHYYAFLMHLLWRPVAVVIVLTILFSLFAIGTAVFAYYTLKIDPADDAVLCGEASSVSSNRTTAGTVHCYLCEKDVDNSSKHCRFCDKCIVRFDHHCKWLNTCIGMKNYAYFLGIVASVLLLSSESLGISIALVVEAFAYPNNLMDRVHYHDFLKDRIGSDLSLGALQGLLIASVVVLLGLVGMLVQLASFHVVLLSRGITTYDYIVSEQKRLRDNENKRLQLKVERQQKARSRTVGAAADHKAGAGAELSNNSSAGAGVEMRAATASGGADPHGDDVREASIRSSGETKRTDPGTGTRYESVPNDNELCEGADTDVISYEAQQQLHDQEETAAHAV